MCCNQNFQSGCGCVSSSCCCCGGNGAATLPIYPDCSSDIAVDAFSGFPVYVSVPGRLTGGSANLAASVNVSGSRCPYARG